MISVRIALIGPSELSEFDQKEIEENLEDFLSKGNEIAILAYRSIEIEVFKYFIEHIEQTPLLHIYTFQPFSLLPEKVKASIEFLVENGATYQSFDFEEILIRRTMYVETWKVILEDCDLVVCFYDGEKPTLMIPVDEAKKMQKKSVIYRLPKRDEELFLREAEEKIRIIDEF